MDVAPGLPLRRYWFFAAVAGSSFSAVNRRDDHFRTIAGPSGREEMSPKLNRSWSRGECENTGATQWTHVSSGLAIRVPAPRGTATCSSRGWMSESAREADRVSFCAKGAHTERRISIARRPGTRRRGGQDTPPSASAPHRYVAPRAHVCVHDVCVRWIVNWPVVVWPWPIYPGDAAAGYAHPADARCR